MSVAIVSEPVTPPTTAIHLFIWANTAQHAFEALALPPTRYPRYTSEAAAREASALGVDGFPDEGEHLFRVGYMEVQP